MDGSLERELHNGTDARGQVPVGTDLIEWYYERGFTDGLPVVPPTSEKVAAVVAALGGEAQFEECRVAPRWGLLTREVMAINMVRAGCRPAYAPVVRAAMQAITDRAFNLNGVQATTHMAAPLVVVNGPIARAIGMNGGANAFGSGNRANATIGRAIRLLLLNVGGGWPGDFGQSYTSKRTGTCSSESIDMLALKNCRPSRRSGCVIRSIWQGRPLIVAVVMCSTIVLSPDGSATTSCCNVRIVRSSRCENPISLIGMRLSRLTLSPNGSIPMTT